MTRTTELSVIIVNWNTRDLLRDCLAALHVADLPQPTETIVVDNGSTDGSVAMVVAEFPSVEVLANERNLGYSRANNQALCRASGQQVLLLNSDTRVSPQGIRTLMRFMDAHPHAGACAPHLVTADGGAQPFAYGGEPTLTYLLRRGVFRCLLRRGLHDWERPGVQEVGWASGACLLVRREVVDAVGPLDESMFMYFEDVDWCLRMRKLGWRVFVQPEAVVTHLGGGSLRQNPEARRCYYRSLSVFYAKHYGRLAQALMEAGLWFYRRISPQEDG
jgi:N-acetylglucosaminyl-diphospho-decaprenol L-rhamnosyltransferase